MAGLSDALERSILNSVLRNQPFTPPAKVYLALFTGDPTDSGNGPEVSTTAWPSYARQDCAQGGPNDAAWNIPPDTPGVDENLPATNTKLITFPAHNGTASLTITHAALFDAASGGKLLFSTKLEKPKIVDVDDIIAFPIGTVIVTLDENN